MDYIRQQLHQEPYYLPEKGKSSLEACSSRQASKRCLKCASLSPQNLISSGSLLQHHLSFRKFEAAALDGCELCKLLLWNVQFSKCTPEDRRDLYDVLRHEDKPLVICWGNNIPELKEQPPQVLIQFAEHKVDLDAPPTIEDGSDPESAVASADIIVDGAEPYEYDNICLTQTERVEKVKEWMESCANDHQRCQALRRFSCQDVRKPARLIRVGSIEADPHLVPYDCSMATWAALSYVWGPGGHTLITTKENIEQRMQSISLSDMPRTFRDAVDLCRQLQIPYLWIDALCIIQPVSPDFDEEDWQTESAIMGQIYSQATLTIAATNAASVDEGCFTDRSSKMDSAPNACHVFAGGDPSNLVALPFHPEWWKAVPDAPLGRRAWTLQEQALSWRTIHCTEYGIYWECTQLDASEFHHYLENVGQSGILYKVSSYKRDTEPPSLETKAKLTGKIWSELVSGYSERKLTFKSDRLLAISAIAQQIQHLTDDEYLAGHWRSNLLSSLLWYCYADASPPSRRTLPRPQGLESLDIKTHSNYVAPSWSWASIVGKIKMRTDPLMTEYAVITSVTVQAINSTNPCGQVEPGATISLASRIRHGARTGLRSRDRNEEKREGEGKREGEEKGEREATLVSYHLFPEGVPLNEEDRELRYEFSAHPEDPSIHRESIGHYIKISGDPPRCDVARGFERITHDGCIILDTAADIDVEFSLLLISVDTPGWIEDEDFDLPDEHAWCSGDEIAIAFGALAVTATGRPNEYRRIGYADIHDRRFFAGTRDVEISLI